MASGANRQQAMTKPIHIIVARTALVLGSLLASIGLAELWTRRYKPFHLATLGADSLRPAEDPELAYTFAPGVQGHNTHGFAGGAFGPKQPDVFRIALMGDSIAYGMGADPDETPALALERALTVGSAEGERRWEVFNFGVPGYSILNQQAQLRHYVLPLEPDLVVLLACLNDWDTDSPEFREVLFNAGDDVGPLRSYYDPTATLSLRLAMRSHLYRHLRFGSGGKRDRHAGEQKNIHDVDDPVESHYDETDFYPEAFERLATPLQHQGIPLLVMLVPHDPWRRPESLTLYQTRLSELQGYCERLGCTTVDGLQAVRGTPRSEHDLPAYHEDRIHPTAIGNELLGVALGDAVLTFTGRR